MSTKKFVIRTQNRGDNHPDTLSVDQELQLIDNALRTSYGALPQNLIAHMQVRSFGFVVINSNDHLLLRHQK